MTIAPGLRNPSQNGDGRSSVFGDESTRCAQKPSAMRFEHMLRRYRLLRGLKQAALAELLLVSQATISKWEKGDQVPSTERQVQFLNLLAAKPQWLNDTWLKRLVEGSSHRVHVICDLTHRLLVASPSRFEEWGCSPNDMFGEPLLHDAPSDIIDAEAMLGNMDMRRNFLRPMVVETTGLTSGRYRVDAGHLLWEKIQIQDGSWVRLVTSLGQDDLPPDALMLGRNMVPQGN